MAVPTAQSLAEIYPEAALSVQKTRWQQLLQKFEQLYGHPADFISRSPGRVNIIGEVGKFVGPEKIH
jgi:galactokinase